MPVVSLILQPTRMLLPDLVESVERRGRLSPPGRSVHLVRSGRSEEMAEEKRITACAKCGEPREYRKECGPCAKAYRSARYSANRIEILAKQAAYDALHREEKAAYNAKYNAGHRVEKATYDSAYYATHRKEIGAYKAVQQDGYSGRRRASHPNIVKAREALNSSIRRGRLVRGSCDECGRKPEVVNGQNVIEFHHAYGYEPENWLRGRWLCQRCHGAADAALGKNQE